MKTIFPKWILSEIVIAAASPRPEMIHVNVRVGCFRRRFRYMTVLEIFFFFIF